MSVTVALVGPCTWRVTAEPDSGKAFWSVEVRETPRPAKNSHSMAPVMRAVRKARRIDKQFSVAEIDRREARRMKRRQQLHDIVHHEQKENQP